MSNKKDVTAVVTKAGTNAGARVETTALDRRVLEAADDILDTSLQSLGQRDALGPVETIHHVRVGMKQLRAFLRLARPALADEHYVELNGLCRQLAADLSGQRDADVALETLKSLAPDEKALINRLENLLHCSAATSVSQPPDWQQIETRLLALKQQVHADLRPGMQCRTLEKTVSRSFRQSIQMWKQAQNDGSEEVLHEWRKLVKRAYYQSLLLCSDKKVKRLRRLKQLSDYLGDLHDLDMLAQRLESERRYFWLDELVRVCKRIDTERANLHRKSVQEGKALFRGKSGKTLAKRLVRKSSWC
ncbi:CHAD domain-containing protein [Marinobacterium lutimaris]|uniref:CHAD domain-containing protein n=1 Tax=Marinobacterium lutimaris TaxID=568106 RepID=A0A1H6DJX5_9GAMM|nr:CHAD domain-containing protein [Marinobacterium lutimaris]SEG85015.1 CHAD domain-containing protein [Marinobacterium lutimaris]